MGPERTRCRKYQISIELDVQAAIPLLAIAVLAAGLAPITAEEPLPVTEPPAPQPFGLLDLDRVQLAMQQRAEAEDLIEEDAVCTTKFHPLWGMQLSCQGGQTIDLEQGSNLATPPAPVVISYTNWFDGTKHTHANPSFMNNYVEGNDNWLFHATGVTIIGDDNTVSSLQSTATNVAITGNGNSVTTTGVNSAIGGCGALLGACSGATTTITGNDNIISTTGVSAAVGGCGLVFFTSCTGGATTITGNDNIISTTAPNAAIGGCGNAIFNPCVGSPNTITTSSYTHTNTATPINGLNVS